MEREPVTQRIVALSPSPVWVDYGETRSVNEEKPLGEIAREIDRHDAPFEENRPRLDAQPLAARSERSFAGDHDTAFPAEGDGEASRRANGAEYGPKRIETTLDGGFPVARTRLQDIGRALELLRLRKRVEELGLGLRVVYLSADFNSDIGFFAVAGRLLGSLDVCGFAIYVVLSPERHSADHGNRRHKSDCVLHISPFRRDVRPRRA